MRVVSVFLTLASVSWPVFAGEKKGVELKTAHYDLYTDASNPKEIAEILEQFYAKLKGFFQGEPHERLRVQSYGEDEEYRKALLSVGRDPRITPEGAYLPRTRTVYARLYPAPWKSRHHLLHECVHQFYSLGFIENKVTKSPLFEEGLAEYLAGSRWDGTALSIGVYDTATNDFALRGLRIVAAHPERLLRDAIVDQRYINKEFNEIELDYSEARAIITFLATEYPQKFQRLIAQFDKGVDPGEAWDVTFAGTGFSATRLDNRYREWLREHIEPMEGHLGDWDRLDQKIEGLTVGSAYGWAIVKPHQFIMDGDGVIWKPVQEISTKIVPKVTGTDAGLVVAIKPASTSCTLILLSETNTIEVLEMTGKETKLVQSIPQQEKTRPSEWTMSAHFHKGAWHVYLDKQEVVSIPSTDGTSLGLAVKGHALFETDLDTK
jgi:hypothetical protein